jgi:hypothetical protein
LAVKIHIKIRWVAIPSVHVYPVLVSNIPEYYKTCILTM